MALELESSIMRQIGFAQHYNWHNGSRACGGVRKEAARKLPQIIQKSHDEGAGIAAPNHALCNLVWKVASTYGVEVDMMGEPSDDVLTKTWQCASDVIQAHISLYHATPEQQQAIIKKITADIRQNYGLLQTGDRFYRKGDRNWW